jgi:hypothetical protein
MMIGHSMIRLVSMKRMSLMFRLCWNDLASWLFYKTMIVEFRFHYHFEHYISEHY